MIPQTPQDGEASERPSDVASEDDEAGSGTGVHDGLYVYIMYLYYVM